MDNGGDLPAFKAAFDGMFQNGCWEAAACRNCKPDNALEATIMYCRMVSLAKLHCIVFCPLFLFLLLHFTSLPDCTCHFLLTESQLNLRVHEHATSLPPCQVGWSQAVQQQEYRTVVLPLRSSIWVHTTAAASKARRLQAMYKGTQHF